MNEHQKELELGITALEQASETVLALFENIASAEVQLKLDRSPLTQADQESNKIISKTLKDVFEYPVLSEETHDDLLRLSAKRVWILDPLDGTREFLSKRNEFSINLALVEEGEAVLGIIALPAQGKIYHASKGRGAFLKTKSFNTKLQVGKKNVLSNLTVAVSRSHLNPATEALLEKIENCHTLSLGSALKYCLVAEGEIDATIRKTPLHEWDLAAADCILKEAGAEITSLSGKPFIYNQRKTLLDDGVLAANPFLHQILLTEIIGV